MNRPDQAEIARRILDEAAELAKAAQDARLDRLASLLNQAAQAAEEGSVKKPPLNRVRTEGSA